MAKRPPRQSSAIRQIKAWTLRRLKPIMWVSGVVAVLGGGLITAEKAWPVVRPAVPVVYYWFDLVQHENRKALDYLILKDERNELKDAQEDLRQNPGSRTAKDKVETFQQSIATREKRLRPTPGNDGGNW